MLSKNPTEAFCIKKTNDTLAFTPTFSLADPNLGMDPGKIYHTKFSKVRIAIIKKGEGSVYANIRYPNDWYGIAEGFKTAMRLDMEQALKSEVRKKEISIDADVDGVDFTSPAFTVAMSGIFKGKTAAEVVLEANEADVKKHIEFLEGNKLKYKSNQLQIDAITEALKLKDEGVLTKATAETTEEKSVESSENEEAFSEVVLYNAFAHGSLAHPHKKVPKKYFTFDCNIKYHFGWNYPVEISIKNYYCPITVTATGKQTVVVREAIDSKEFSMKASVSDFCAMLEMVEQRKDVFLMNHAGEIEKAMEDVNTAWNIARKEGIDPALTEVPEVFDSPEAENVSPRKVEEKKVTSSNYNFNGEIRTTGKPGEDGSYYFVPVITETNEHLTLLFAKKEGYKWLKSFLKEAEERQMKLFIRGKRKENAILFGAIDATSKARKEESE